MNEHRYKIYLPSPHPKQAAFIDSQAKRKVIVAGRRGGKTVGAALLAADKALDGRRVLEAAPTADQTGAFWAAIKTYFAEPIQDKRIYKNETDRLIELPSGGRIRCKTAFDADTLRGDYADLLILDEYSLMKASAWDEVGAPMLLDNNGDAVFIFTPKRKNHAFSMYANSIGDMTGRWAGWHFTSFDNPFLDRKALNDIIADMTEDAYRQEIMAEFLENEGAVFRNIKACINAPKEAKPEDHGEWKTDKNGEKYWESHRIFIGCDWGKQQDYSVFSVGCATCKMEVDRDRSNKIEYIMQRQRLEVLYNKWKPSTILAESNAMGDPIIEVLRQSGLPVIGFETTASSKPPLIENMALALEKAEWQFQDDPIWTAEMEAYERKISLNTGRSSYGAPEGMNDDTVIGRALMLWASNTPSGSELFASAG